MPATSYTETFHDVIKYAHGDTIEDEKRVLRNMHTHDRGEGKRTLKRVDAYVPSRFDARKTYELFDGAEIGPSTVQRRVPGAPATRTFPALDSRFVSVRPAMRSFLSQPETQTVSDHRSMLVNTKLPSAIAKRTMMFDDDENAVGLLCFVQNLSVFSDMDDKDENAVDILCSMQSSRKTAKHEHGST